MITKIEAVRSLFGQDSYDVCRADGYVKWKDGHTTTAEETAQIDAEVIRLQTEYNSQEYARSRAAEYPSIGDQLDMIYHNGDGGATFQAAIKAVKDKYPK
jgi:hypothetical protein|tara:strand:+ start:492 stop:791 length:300 start_codon:yes stop_codon:yes gene_type:complete